MYKNDGNRLPSIPFIFENENCLTKDPRFKEYLKTRQFNPLKTENFKFDQKGALAIVTGKQIGRAHV